MSDMTYTTTPDGSIVRRHWIGMLVYVSILRVGAVLPMFVGITIPTGAGYKAVGMLRALNSERELGVFADYIDAESALLAHRSGRRSIEAWNPPTGVVRTAAARATLAARRAEAKRTGAFGFSIADLFDDLSPVL